MDLSLTIASLIEIVWLSLILSGDNAVLLAQNTRALPMEQRRLGVNLGTILFILLRIALAYGLFALLAAPGLALAGAALLLLGAPALARRGAGEFSAPERPRRSLAAALWACLLADAPVALVNMLALHGAAQGAGGGERSLVLFGLALSIPLLALGSTQIITVLRRPPLLWAGAGLLGWVAGQLAAADALAPVAAAPFAPPLGAALALLLAFLAWRGLKTPGAVDR